KFSKVILRQFKEMKKTKNFTRRAFIGGTLITGLGLTLNLGSCGKSIEQPLPTDPEPTPPNKDNALQITDVALPASIEVSKGAEFTITGKGYAMGDHIIFDPLIISYARVTPCVYQVSADTAVVLLVEQIKTS